MNPWLRRIGPDIVVSLIGTAGVACAVALRPVTPAPALPPRPEVRMICTLTSPSADTALAWDGPVLGVRAADGGRIEIETSPGRWVAATDCVGGARQ